MLKNLLVLIAKSSRVIQSTVILLTGMLASAASFAFVHPGIINTTSSLQAVKAKVAAGEQPWKSAFERLQHDPTGSLTYRPQADWSVIDCGPRDGTPPNPACAAERKDARAAYSQALLWTMTGNQTYAKNAVNIMNAWANTLKQGHTNSNRALQAAWTGAMWPKAAEIIRATYSGWSNNDIDKFKTMLNTQYIASINSQDTRCYFGNWLATISEAKMNIAIFNDNQAMYNEALQRWRQELPAYIYLSQDGDMPKTVADCPKLHTTAQIENYWSGQKQGTFFNGQIQETCRDLEHSAYGLAAFIDMAETARIQGSNLYQEGRQRLTAAMEFNTPLDSAHPVIPDGLCSNKISRLGGFTGTLLIGYNHYARQEKLLLPNTTRWMKSTDLSSPGRFHYAWETLTHGGVLAQ